MTTINAPRRARRLRNAAASIAAAAVLTLGATACEPTGCQLDCIGTVSTDLGATKVKVPTTVPTKLYFELFSDSAMTKSVAKVSAANLVTQHSLALGQLKSATTYWWRATATDANNVQRVETGSFKTFRREIAVTITRIKLTDDSDYFGDAEATFHLKINDDVFPGVYSNADMPTGTDIKNLTITRTATNTGNPLTIKVEGIDDDTEGSLDTGGTYPGFGNGSNSNYDWATASFGPTTLPANDGSGSWSAKTTNQNIKFEVYGTWKVTYKAL